MVQPYSKIDAVTDWKKSHFILHMIDKLPIAVYVFPVNMLLLL